MRKPAVGGTSAVDKAAAGTAVGDTASMAAADRPGTRAGPNTAADRVAGIRYLNCWNQR